MSDRNLRNHLANLSQEEQDYFLQHLPAILAAENEIGALQRLLWSFDFLQAKLAHPASSSDDLLADLALRPEDIALQQVAVALRQAAHIIEQDVAQVAGQLIGRLLAYQKKYEQIQRLLDAAWAYAEQPFLRPRLPLPVTNREAVIRLFHAHAGAIKGMTLTPDDQTLIVTYGNGLIIVYDFVKNRVKHQLKGSPGYWKQPLAVTPDGQLFVRGVDKQIEIWQLDIGILQQRWEWQEGLVNRLGLSHDGRTGVMVLLDNTTMVWDLTTGVILYVLSDHPEWKDLTVLLVDEQYVVTKNKDKHDPEQAMKVWNWQTNQLTNAHPIAPLADNHSIHFWGDNALASIQGRSLLIKEIDTEQVYFRLTDSAPIQHAVVTSSGDYAATAAEEHVTIWDLTTPTLMEPSQAKSNLVRRARAQMPLALTADGQYALSAFSSNEIAVWQLHDEVQRRFNLCGHTGEITSLAPTWDRRHVVSIATDQSLRLWDLTTQQAIRILRANKPLRALSITPDGCYALVAAHYNDFGLEESELILWDLKKGEIVKTIQGHSRKVNALALRADGFYAFSAAGIAFASRDQAITVWDMRTGKIWGQLAGHQEAINSLALTHNGRYLLSGAGKTENRDNSVRLWDLATGQILQTHLAHTMRTNAVAITPNGRYAVSASSDQSVKLWSLYQGTGLAGFTIDFPAIACAISSNGIVAVGDEEGELYMFSLCNAPLDAPVHLPIQYSATETTLYSTD